MKGTIGALQSSKEDALLVEPFSYAFYLLVKGLFTCTFLQSIFEVHFFQKICPANDLKQEHSSLLLKSLNRFVILKLGRIFFLQLRFMYKCDFEVPFSSGILHCDFVVSFCSAMYK